MLIEYKIVKNGVTITQRVELDGADGASVNMPASEVKRQASNAQGGIVAKGNLPDVHPAAHGAKKRGDTSAGDSEKPNPGAGDGDKASTGGGDGDKASTGGGGSGSGLIIVFGPIVVCG